MKSFPGLSSLLGLHKEEKGSTVKRVNEKVAVDLFDSKSLESFRRADLRRERFSYKQLAEINWWPDEVLRLLEILFITYNQFINVYRSDVGSVDSAIRNAIYFMNQKKYATIPAVSKFINNGDFKIVDGYLAAVIAEDNCYMRESDDRHRSSNEYKHHLLVKALEALIALSPIREGELVLKTEYEEKIRTFLTIYNLKNIYAITDDSLRTVLQAVIVPADLGIDLREYFRMTIDDIDQRVLLHLSKHYDEHLFNAAHTFRDLMSYAYCCTSYFSHIFHPLTTNGSLSSSVELRPIRPYLQYDNETIGRLEYVYGFYLKLVATREFKQTILLDNQRFDEIMTSLSSSDSKKPTTPRYLPYGETSAFPPFKENGSPTGEGESKLRIETSASGLFILPLSNPFPPVMKRSKGSSSIHERNGVKASIPAGSHERRSSLDRIVVRRSSFREDLLEANKHTDRSMDRGKNKSRESLHDRSQKTDTTDQNDDSRLVGLL